MVTITPAYTPSPPPRSGYTKRQHGCLPDLSAALGSWTLSVTVSPARRTRWPLGPTPTRSAFPVFPDPAFPAVIKGLEPRRGAAIDLFKVV